MFRFEDKTCLPVIVPFKTYNEVKRWCPPESEDDLQYYSKVSLQPRKVMNESRTKLIVCHDMMGGYLQDRYCTGLTADNTDGYVFFHWPYVDIFIYFAHDFISVPPPGWVTAAHVNGVKILGTVFTNYASGINSLRDVYRFVYSYFKGTLITEFDNGRDICSQFLSSNKEVDFFTDQLIEIAKLHRLDGWFLNIENVIKTELLPNLLSFVKVLTIKVKKVFGSEGIVLWYDSVTKTGALDWQNELNDKNMQYFECCDGIFLNYTWKFETLESTVEKSRSRQQDVYVGIDVFGRNCFGGGGFNSWQALSLIRSFGLSAAIFAQGWVYECLPKDKFLQNEMKFWSFLTHFCRVNVPIVLPFYTNFSIGKGDFIKRDGKVVSDKSWYDLSQQAIQVLWQGCGDTKSALNCLIEPFSGDAFDGGCCLKLSGTCNRNTTAFTKLVCCDFQFDSYCSLVFKYSFKVLGGNRVDMQGTLGLGSGEDAKWLFPGEDNIGNVESDEQLLNSGWISRSFKMQINHSNTKLSITSIGFQILSTNVTDESSYTVLIVVSC